MPEQTVIPQPLPATSAETPAKKSQSAEIERALGLDRRSTWRRRIFRLVIVLAIGGAIYYGYTKWKEQQALAAIPQYQTAPAKRGDLTRTVTATGTLEPTTKVEVGSEVSGRIEEVTVDFNDEVKKDQILAKLNTIDLEARVKQAEASLKLAKADEQRAAATVTETEQRSQRVRRLSGDRTVSREEVEQAEAEAARAKASLVSAQAQVAVSQANLDADSANLLKATVISPIDGIVLSRLVQPGQTVAASFQTPILFTLAKDLKRMELLVDVDEADVGEVLKGQKAFFRVDAYDDKKFPAKVVSVRNDPQVEQDVVTYKAVLEVDNSELLLRPGMTATAEIITAEVKDVLMMPNTALRYTPEGTDEEATPSDRTRGTVWKLVENVPTPIPVTLGLSDSRHTVVVNGDVKDGLELVTNKVQKDK